MSVTVAGQKRLLQLRSEDLVTTGEVTSGGELNVNSNLDFSGGDKKKIKLGSQETYALPAQGTKMRILTLANLTSCRVYIDSSENAYNQPIVLDIFYNSQSSQKPVIHRNNTFQHHTHSNDIRFTCDTSGHIYAEKVAYSTGRTVNIRKVEEFKGTVTILDGSTTQTGGGTSDVQEGKFGSLDVTGNIIVGGTVDGIDIATRDGILSGTTIIANAALPKNGGIMAGALTLSGAPSSNLHAATKAYVDGAVIANTDTQDLSISGQTLSLTNGGSVTIPTTSITTAAVSDGATTLATGDQIFDHVTTRISGLTGDQTVTNSISTTSSTIVASATAAKAAYDRGSTGVTNAASAQTTANAALPKSGGTMSGALTGGNNMLSSFFLPQNPEGNHVKAPWFFNDMAYSRLRGATVTVTVNGGTAPGNSEIDAMFDASTGFWNMATSGVSTVVIEMTNPPKNLTHGAHYGVTFGNTHWRSKSVKIEAFYSSAYQDIVDLTNQTQEFVYGADNSGGNAVTKIKWTFSNFNTTSMRIVSLFAYNYNATGMPSLYLTKDGGEMFGSIDLNGNNITEGGSITATSLDINGSADISGNLTGVDAFTASGKIQGAELEGTSLDINGAADISGTLNLGGDTTFGTNAFGGSYLGVGTNGITQWGASRGIMTWGTGYAHIYASSGNVLKLGGGGGNTDIEIGATNIIANKPIQQQRTKIIAPRDTTSAGTSMHFSETIVGPLAASGTQAREYELARVFMDYNDWNASGGIEVELYENYYDEGAVKKYSIGWGYNNTVVGPHLFHMAGSTENNQFDVTVGSLVQVGSTDIYYLPIKVRVRYYSQCMAILKTNRNLVADAANSTLRGVYINTEATSATGATNISDFTALKAVTLNHRASSHYLGGNVEAGGSLTGTSLDINGAADISGNLVITGDIKNNIENGSLDLYGGTDATNDAHIKLYGNNSQWASIVMDHGYDATNSKFIVNQGGTERFKIQNNVAYFSGKIQGAGEIEGTSLDINGNADISGTLNLTGKTTISVAGNDAYTPTAFNNKSVLVLKSSNADTNYTGIQFTNTAGNYEWFLGTNQVGSNFADMVFQGHDRSAGVYKEYLRISDNGDTNFVGDITMPTAGSQIKIGSFSDGSNNSGEYANDDLVIGDGSISIYPHRRGDYASNESSATSTTFRSKLNVWSDAEDHITFGGANTHMVSAWESWKTWINNDSGGSGTFHLYHTNAKTEFARFSGDGTTSFITGKFYVNGELEATSLDIDGAADISGNLTVGGNLIITGDIDSYNTTTLDVTDKTITVSKGGTAALANGAGLIVDRGSSSDATILWNHSNSKFIISDDVEISNGLVVGDAVVANGVTLTGDQNISGIGTNATAISTLTTAVGANEVTANAALPKAGGTMTGTLTMNGQQISSTGIIKAGEFRLDTLGDAITFYGGGQLQHSISAKDASGNAADDLRINSYGAVYINLDSNSNNSSTADFVVGRHGDATGTITQDLLSLSGENGKLTVNGEVEATSLDINGAADISGALVVGGSVMTLTAPDEGSAPAMTAVFNMRGYEGRGVGIKMRPHVTSAASATNAEWFVGSGYGQSGFNIGYAADGSQSSYIAQSKVSITTSGAVAIVGTVKIGTMTNANADTDRFLVSDTSKIVRFRTGAEVRSDIGAGTGNSNLALGTTSSTALRGDLITTTSSTSTTQAATANAVRLAYSRGNLGVSEAQSAATTASEASTIASAALPKAGGTMTGKITLDGAPSSNLHAATKAYVDGAVIANTDTQDLSISGQTLSLTNGGSVTLPDTNTQLSLSNSISSTSTTVAASSAAAKSAYDRGSTGITNAASAQTTANAALPKSGGTMSGNITLGSNKVIGMPIVLGSASGMINRTAAQFTADGAVVYVGSNNYGWNDARDWATQTVSTSSPTLDQNDQYSGIICPVALSQVTLRAQVRMNSQNGTMIVKVYKMNRATAVATSNLALTEIGSLSVSTMNGRFTTADIVGSTAVAAGDLILVGFGKTDSGAGQKPRFNFTLSGTTS